MSPLLDMLLDPDFLAKRNDIVDHVHSKPEEYEEFLAFVFQSSEPSALEAKNRLLDIVDMMKAKYAVQLMTYALQDPEKSIRVRGLQSIYRRQVDSLNEQIVALMQDTQQDFEIRKWAIHIMSCTDPNAFGILLRKCARNLNEDIPVRKEAIFALTTIDADETIGTLCATLGDANDEIRASGAWALAKIGSQDGISCLLAALDDEFVKVRDWAIRGLRDMDDGRALQGLADALRRVEPVEQTRMIRLMVEKRSEIILRAIAELLQSTDVEVRRQATWAMGVSPYPPAVAELEKLEEDPDEIVRTYAKKALVRLGRIDPTELGFKI